MFFFFLFQNHLAMFATIIDEIALDYFSTIDDQTIVLEFYKSLLRKNMLEEVDLQKRITDKCNGFIQVIRQHNVESRGDIDFDRFPHSMKSIFQFAMLTRNFRLFDSVKVKVFDQACRLVLKKPFEANRNRKFVGMCYLLCKRFNNCLC